MTTEKMIVIGCPKCKTKVRVPEDRRGKPYECQQCGHVMTVPPKPPEQIRPAAAALQIEKKARKAERRARARKFVKRTLAALVLIAVVIGIFCYIEYRNYGKFGTLEDMTEWFKTHGFLRRKDADEIHLFQLREYYRTQFAVDPEFVSPISSEINVYYDDNKMVRGIMASWNRHSRSIRHWTSDEKGISGYEYFKKIRECDVQVKQCLDKFLINYAGTTMQRVMDHGSGKTPNGLFVGIKKFPTTEDKLKTGMHYVLIIRDGSWDY